jgi:hypothetical protein
MPARKMRVELFDSDGNRYTIGFEGQVTREKAVRLLDLVELLGGISGREGDNTGSEVRVEDDGFSKYDRIRTAVQTDFPLAWFSSTDVQKLYEQKFKEPIALSTVATYLSRLTTKGMLTRAGALNNLKYRSVQGLPQARIRQKV